MPPKITAPSERPISFHYNYSRDPGEPFGRCTFIVVVAEEVINTANRGHPLRYATIKFNSCARPDARVQALADCLRETLDQTADESKPSLMGRFFGLVARAVLAVRAAF